jgi:hypothetical protein
LCTKKKDRKKKDRKRKKGKVAKTERENYLATSPAAGSRHRYCGLAADYKSVLRQLIDG